MLVYKGKTKDLYKDDRGMYYFKFKDDVTGKDGVFDPGENQVGASIEGSGLSNLIISTYYFKLLEDKGIPTHFISSKEEDLTMHIKNAELFGKGLELICRYKATGSFMRRYGLYAKEGQDLDSYVEFTLKDDERGDPLITKDGLIQLSILNEKDYDKLKDLTINISEIIREDLRDKGLDLYDIKLEFGRLDSQDSIALIDEVSAGNMRVYKSGKYIDPLELVNYFK